MPVDVNTTYDLSAIRSIESIGVNVMSRPGGALTGIRPPERPGPDLKRRPPVPPKQQIVYTTRSSSATMSNESQQLMLVHVGESSLASVPPQTPSSCRPK